MKRILVALAFLCSLAASAQTAVVGTKVLDNTGALLSSGQWCFGSSCFTVTAGAFTGSVTAGTQTVTITNGGSTTYLTIPNVTIAGSYFSFDTYVVASNAFISGMGVPRIACTVGATYTQTDGNGNGWQCQGVNGQGQWNGLPAPGTPNTITIGATTTLPAGMPAQVVNAGTSSAPILNFGIPQGSTGPAGPTGPAGANGSINGPWSSSTAYSANTTVTYNGNVFYALSANTNQTPPSTCTANTYWQNAVCNIGVAGLTSDSNSGTVTAGSAQVGTLYKVYKCAGADPTDGNAINAMLANGAGVYLTLLGNCVDNTVVINLKSNQTIDGGRTASIAFTPSSVPSPVLSGMIQNVDAGESATRSFTDGVTTANSNTLTSASGASFVAGDVGQGITCTGVLGSSLTEQGVTIPNSFSTVIRAVVSATQIALVDAPPVTASSVSCSIYYRDTNITVRGLKVVNNGPNCGAGTNNNWWITYFMHVSGLVLEDDTFQDGTTGLTSGNGCKQVLISDTSNVRIVNDTLQTWNIYEDGFDMFGAVNDVYIAGISGSTGDDMVALQSTTNGFVSSFPIQGPIHNINMVNNSFSSLTGGMKTYGPDQIGYLPITNVTLAHTKCVQAAVGSTSATGGNMTRGLLIIGGTQDNFTVDDMSGSCVSDVQLSGTLYHGIFSNLSIDPSVYYTGSRILYSAANTYQTAPVYGDIAVEHVRFNGALQYNPFVQFTDAGSIIGSIKLDDFQVTNTAALSSSVYYVSLLASSIGALNVRNMGITYGTGSTANAPTIYVGPASGSSTTVALGSVSINDSFVNVTSGTDGPFPFLELLNISTSPVVSFKNVSLTSATASTLGYLVGAFSTGSPGTLGTPTYVFQNDTVTNMSGCVERVGNATAYPTGWSGVESLNNLFSVTTPASCPSANQIGPTTVAGAVNGLGLHTNYDNIKLNYINAPVAGTPTTAATGGSGSLTDNTTFYYKICSVNSVGANCSAEKSILVCPSSTCSNLSTVSLPITTQGANAQSYSVYRASTSGSELLCASLTGVGVYSSTILDTGAACSGAAVPTSNTSVPGFVLTNSNNYTSTINPSAASSAITTTMPSTTGGTLAITSQLPSIRAGSWSISASTSVAVTFSPSMSAAPTTCQLTPSGSSASTGQPEAQSLAASGFNVVVPTSGTLSGTYLCTINNSN